MVVYWLYNITGDKFLLDLGELIHKQTFNWTDIFLNQDHLSRQLSLHCVNLAQGFKEPVVYYQQNQDPKQICAVKKAVKDILFAAPLYSRGNSPRFDNEHTTYENIKVGDADATLGTSVGENGDTVYILSWEQGGVSNTIMGNISRDEIVRIAENVF